jgi:hypothetical protein
MAGPEIVPHCLALALFSATGGFWAVAGFLLRGGKEGARELGCVELGVALIHLVAICFLLSVGAGWPAVAVFFLGLPWFALGLKDFAGLPVLKPVGDWCWVLTISFVCGAVYVWTQMKVIVLGLQLISYAGIGLLLSLVSYGKMSPKVLAYYLLVVATALILIPGIASWCGIPLP